MGAAFLITLREGLEAALIVAVVLAYLRQLGRRDQFRAIGLGTAAAVLLSLAAGAGLYFAIGGLEGDPERLAFGFTSLAATGVLTWMIFWMRQQARSIGRELRQHVDKALAIGTVTALASVVFFGVLREGLETVLFLLAVVVGSSAFDLAVGASAGLLSAIALGYAFYQGGRRINLRLFFQLTGGLIIVVAAGLFSRGVAWLQEAGLLNTYHWPLWNVTANPILGHGTFAEFLNGLFGWNPQPSLEEAIAWAAFLALAGSLFYFGLPSLAWLDRRVERLPSRAAHTASPVQAADAVSPIRLLVVASLVSLVALGFFSMTRATDARPEETVSLAEEREERLISGGIEGAVTDAPPIATVSVALDDAPGKMFLTPDISSVPAGPIQFMARNVGSMNHELIIIKTDLPPDQLPVDGRTAMAAVTGPGLKVVGEIEPFQPGETRQATFQLEPGRYVLICNLPGHYQMGMFTGFQVR